MKFARYLTLLIIFIIQSFTKKIRHNHSLSGDSQSTRNYRKLHTDPSYNPLPQSWSSGAINSFAQHSPQKYNAYNSQLNNQHSYSHTSNVMAERARHSHK